MPSQTRDEALAFRVKVKMRRVLAQYPTMHPDLIADAAASHVKEALVEMGAYLHVSKSRPRRRTT